ncbi:MAG: LamG domain-containing protein [Anaerolineales bacterium]|nr:LamG domain-containing protein [Anaerolineales bacterium]
MQLKNRKKNTAITTGAGTQRRFWIALIAATLLVGGLFAYQLNHPHPAFAHLVFPTQATMTAADGSESVPFQTSPPSISDGQFVWGPNVGNFSIESFLGKRNSSLKPYAEVIEAWARYYTINPRVLLAALELNYSLISETNPDLDQETIYALIEESAADLSLAFYEHLYTLGNRGKGNLQALARGGQSFEFEDGTQVEITWSPSSGSYAVAALHAKGNLKGNVPEVQALGGAEDFEAIFGYFFPDTDPLDDSNNLEPDTLPPDDYFQFPFPLGASWRFSGAHSWSGGGSYPDRSSMDFSITWSNYPDPPYKNTVAAAPGEAYIRAPNSYYSTIPCWVEIDHGGGWKTHYYHLVNLGASGEVGSKSQNQLIGGIGEEICNGGFATGPHVHFALFYNGAPYDLEGLKLSGWTVHEGPRDENAYNTGSIERDGTVLEPWDFVTNDYNLYYGDGLDRSLRFNGGASSAVDRLKIPIDDPNRTNPGPPMDIGFHDFVVEWWMKADPGDNNAPGITCGSNSNWKSGNLIFDRSRSTGTHEWGVSLVDGYIAFGVTNGSGSKQTICSSRAVDDGEWHHIAVQRNRWDNSQGAYFDGQLWLFVDGILQESVVGPIGDISYPDSAPIGTSCSTGNCIDDSYLVIGGGKNEAGLPFKGWIDDIRTSGWLRYLADFPLPTAVHVDDALTIALHRLDTGLGNVVYDTGGYDSGTSNGWLYLGGSPPGPEWSLLSPFSTAEPTPTPTPTTTPTATPTNTPVTPTPTATPTPIFADVPYGHWAYAYINALFEAGYVAGCSTEPRLYCPDNILNRAESSVFVLRGQYGNIPDPPYPAPDTPTFTDVATDFWGYGWIESLWTDGFTAGCSTDPLMYCPDNQHTRAEGSVFFLRVKNGASYEPPPPAGLFADVDLNAWYAGWVEAAYNEGILPACSLAPLQFCPEDLLDRSWAAYIMVHAKGGLPLE